MTRWIRLDRVKGKKYVIMVTTGVDTAANSAGKITKKIKDTTRVTVFPISIGWALREYCETHGCTGM